MLACSGGGTSRHLLGTSRTLESYGFNMYLHYNKTGKGLRDIGRPTRAGGQDGMTVVGKKLVF